MKRTIVLMITAILVISALTLSACHSNSTSTSDQATVDTAAAVKTYTISAGGLKIKYPEKWKDTVEVQADEEKAAFSADGTPIFDLYFNREEGDVLGTVKNNNQYTVIRFKQYEAKSTETEAMQEDLSVIIANLRKDYDFVSGDALEKIDDSVFKIKTDVAPLYYPSKWEDKVTVDVKSDRVSFSREDTKLFDIVFAEIESGDYIGSYKGTPVYVVTYEVKDNEAASMQEDLNVILQHLMKDRDYTNK